MEQISYFGTMGDDSYGATALSRFQEAMSRPSTKLVAPSRRPGGPREAFRPFLQNNLHSRPQAFADVREQAHHHSDSTPEDDASSCTNSAEMAEIIEVETSCMDTLDHDLVTSPINCFMEICWAEAIQDDHESDHEDSPTLYNEPLQGGHKHAISSHRDREDNSDDLDQTDNQGGKWGTRHVETDFKPTDTKRYDERDHGIPSIPTADSDQYLPRPVYSPSELPPYSSSPRIRSQTPQASLAFWDPHFTTRNPNDTVHGFPSRPARNTRNRRWKRIDIIASARAHLSGRFIR